MARIANLKIRKLQDGRFIIEEPTELHNGKRHQSTFTSKSKAEKRLADLKAMKSNFGGSLATMSPTRIAEAVEAFKKLDMSGLQVSLLSVIDRFLADHARRNHPSAWKHFLSSTLRPGKRRILNIYGICGRP